MQNTNYIEEELTLLEFADRFLLLNDMQTPEVYDVKGLNIEILTLNDIGEEIYVPMESFIVKAPVTQYYTDGKIKVSSNHRFIENGLEIFAKDHKDFRLVDEQMNVVDLEIPKTQSYLANGRLNHNTTSGGKAIAFHSSVRLRLKLKGKIKDGDDIIGIETEAQVVKNRMGPPLRKALYNIFFDSGIDDISSLLKVLVKHDVIQESGRSFTYGKVKFDKKTFREKVLEDAEVYKSVYADLCEKYVLKYKDHRSDDDKELVISEDLEGIDE